MTEILHHKIVGEGQPLIILHGLFGSLDNWITLGRKFANDYQVVLVDQRNHGKSFHSDEFIYDAMAEDLENLLAHLGLEDVVLIGHSMGGKTVMQFTAYHPDQVDKLIVADIGPKQYPVHHDKIIEGLQSIQLNELGKREEVDKRLAEYIEEMGTRSFLLKNLKRTSSGGFEWKMNLEVIANNITQVGTPLAHYLPIETPSLFLKGENSNYILDEDIPGIEEIFPDSTFESIRDAGHWLHADQPDVFYEKVMEFLDMN